MGTARYPIAEHSFPLQPLIHTPLSHIFKEFCFILDVGKCFFTISAAAAKVGSFTIFEIYQVYRLGFQCRLPRAQETIRMQTVPWDNSHLIASWDWLRSRLTELLLEVLLEVVRNAVRNCSLWSRCHCCSDISACFAPMLCLKDHWPTSGIPVIESRTAARHTGRYQGGREGNPSMHPIIASCAKLRWNQSCVCKRWRTEWCEHASMDSSHLSVSFSLESCYSHPCVPLPLQASDRPISEQARLWRCASNEALLLSINLFTSAKKLLLSRQ